jgi:hypothetical protein
MRMRLLHVIELCALLGAGTVPAAERTVCVPGEDRRWLCGDEATLRKLPVTPPAPPPAAPLPPVLLIDPDRLFGPAPKREAGSAIASTPELPPRTDADALPPGTVTTAPARPEPAPAAASLARRGSHVWQLVRASSPGGFADLLRDRRIDPAEARSLQTRRGDWLLLYGDFPGIEAARAAKSRVGAGFARSWVAVESEL